MKRCNKCGTQSTFGHLHDASCPKRATPLASALDKLRRYGPARNRAYDHQPRSVVLTDDEAVALLWHLGELADAK